MKREYVYNKPVVVKGADGVEAHKTAKLRTPHNETHVICAPLSIYLSSSLFAPFNLTASKLTLAGTNRGPAFTRGSDEPSEVKAALIDRAVVQFVRTLGTQSRSDQEFEQNLELPAVKRRMRMFRILTCIMAMVKMLMQRQPTLRVDLALAQKYWDYWDHGPRGLEQGYNLPTLTPRKNQRRRENCTTLTILNAAAEVFFFKQTAERWDCNAIQKDGQPKPFNIRMLWNVIKIAMPTPEIIHTAWTMGLEYAIGTSSMGMNAMTAIAEAYNFQPSDLLKPRGGFDEDPAEYKIEESVLQSFQSSYQPQAAVSGEEDDEDNNDEQHRKKRRQKSGRAQSVSYGYRLEEETKNSNTCPEFENLLANMRSKVNNDTVDAHLDQCIISREARCQYRWLMSKSSAQSMRVKDMCSMVNAVFKDQEQVEKNPAQVADARPFAAESVASEDSDEEVQMDSFERGRRMARKGEVLSPGNPDKELRRGYHETRAEMHPGCANCQLRCTTSEQRMCCPYCQSDEPVPDSTCQEDTKTLSLHASAALPDAIEVSLFYKPLTLVQWACGEAAILEPGCSKTGTRGSIQFAKRGVSDAGAQLFDEAWVEQEKIDSWHKLAGAVHNGNCSRVDSFCSRTAQMFDYHIDGLRDVFYLMSTRDNARLLPLAPVYLSEKAPDGMMVPANGGMITNSTMLIKPKKMRVNTSNEFAEPGHEELPRHPKSGVKNTILQRRCDFLLRGGAFSAAAVATSNRVVNTAPIRLFDENVQVNTGALVNHLRLLTEAAYTLCKVPGLKNLQERFCNNTTGPPGFSAKHRQAGKRDREEARDDLEDEHHTLPYSYDMIPMSISMRVGAMMYNDIGPIAIDAVNKGIGKEIDMQLTNDNLPELSLRFIGYHEKNRQTISMKVPVSRPKHQEYVEAGDPSIESSGISTDHVSRALGREASQQDVADFIACKQGARAMRGITGDLFASSVWLNHAIASLAERGLIHGIPEEPAVVSLTNMVTCIAARVAEHASEKNIGTGWKMTRAKPRTYEAERKRLIIAHSEQGVKNRERAVLPVAKKQQSRVVFPGVSSLVKTHSVPGFEPERTSARSSAATSNGDELRSKGRMHADQAGSRGN